MLTKSVPDLQSLPTPPLNDELQYYREWFQNEAERYQRVNNNNQIDQYKLVASQTIRVGEQEVQAFAPFQERLSALTTITNRQKIFLWAIFLAYIVSLILFNATAFTLIIFAITLFYVIDVFIFFLIAVRMSNLRTGEQIDESLIHALDGSDWPPYTILCPLYKEVAVVPQFVEAMKTLDYPINKLQILFLTEEEDVDTREAILDMDLPDHFSVITVPDGQPRTKPRACNYGLIQSTGSFVVIYDAEDKPEPLQLKRAILTFAKSSPRTVCVQAKLNFYNPDQNMLTRWFTAEYSAWFDITLPGMQMLKVPLPLGGTSNHFRTDVLRAIGAWDPFNVTEDCDLGLRLGSYGLETVVVDSVTLEEANSQYKNWMRQRSRWIKGYMQTYLVYMRHPGEYFRSKLFRQFLSLQFLIGGKTGVLLVNPLMWLLLLVYICLFPFVAGAYHILYPMPVLYAAVVSLLLGNFLYLYTHLIGCVKSHRLSVVKAALLIPIYWAMASGAAYIALYQLVFKPHYWEKTLHGLHLQQIKVKDSQKLPTIALASLAIASNGSASKADLFPKDTKKLPAVSLTNSSSLTIQQSKVILFPKDTKKLPAITQEELYRQPTGQRLQDKRDQRASVSAEHWNQIPETPALHSNLWRSIPQTPTLTDEDWQHIPQTPKSSAQKPETLSMDGANASQTQQARDLSITKGPAEALEKPHIDEIDTQMPFLAPQISSQQKAIGIESMHTQLMPSITPLELATKAAIEQEKTQNLPSFAQRNDAQKQPVSQTIDIEKEETRILPAASSTAPAQKKLGDIAAQETVIISRSDILTPASPADKAAEKKPQLAHKQKSKK